ncbi:MAG: L-threonylcarbamoyladenylate synthase [Gammaproteobacteria bacterium]|nr:L-threonylcarbamoyladenylate synthase [Gammaproteobacteria bacterium]MDX2477029.1 L-threonylcarbamoyladenylate synthase [Gammaproteobacteria bacterium]MDX2487266.1 L-threonylcarbamoyladenylate synthase [Gammaproteobacteria bacterium]
MAQYFEIHPDNPQKRLINQAVEIINRGGVIAYPTDSSYALGCLIGDKQALDRIRAIRRVDARHNFTLVCRDLSELSIYAKVENNVYRLLKHFTPGAYTFILKATGEVPRRLQNPKRKTIGIRVPDNNISLALLDLLDQPLMSSTLILPDDDHPLSDPDEIREKLGKQVDLIIDGGFCGLEATTVVDMVSGAPEVIRVGKGDPSPFE